MSKATCEVGRSPKPRMSRFAAAPCVRATLCGALCAGLAASGGCGRSKPSRFYTLSPMDRRDGSTVALPPEVQVGVTVDLFPGYLNRPQIVESMDAPRLTVAEFDRWAEPLDQSFLRVLCENLRSRLGSEHVSPAPWKSEGKPTHRVSVDVLRFDGAVGRDIELVARWSVAKDGGEAIETRRSSIRQPCDMPGYEGLAQAMSAAAARLSDDIATAIRDQGAGRTP